MLPIIASAVVAPAPAAACAPPAVAASAADPYWNYAPIRRCYGKAFADSLAGLDAHEQNRRVVAETRLRQAARDARVVELDPRTGIVTRLESTHAGRPCTDLAAHAA